METIVKTLTQSNNVISISTREARDNFGRKLEEAKYENKSFIVNRKGKPLAAIVPIQVLADGKKKQREEDADFFELFESMWEDVRIHNGEMSEQEIEAFAMSVKRDMRAKAEKK